MSFDSLLNMISLKKNFLCFFICCLFLVSCSADHIKGVSMENTAPIATAVMMIDSNGGKAVVGDMLVGRYIYLDSDGDPEAISGFRWYRDSAEIAGATSKKYTLVELDRGATISLAVTPVAATGVARGGLAISISDVFVANAANVANVTNKITQFGITWKFDHDYRYGKFANGDYWVIGPVTVISISPHSIVDATGRTLNGSMINPSSHNGVTQGYDSAMYGKYGPFFDASFNVARPNQRSLTTQNPLMVANNSSLVSAVSLSASGARPQLKTVAVLTVLASAPIVGSFRPSYSGGNKTIKFNKNQLQYSLLKRFSPVVGTPALATVEKMFERPWLDHVPSWQNRYHHPSANMPDYGREISSQIGIGALMLHLDFNDVAKEKLLVRYIQLGIDFYGVAQDGGGHNWSPNGGHQSGRKWPILFAGLMLNDFAMQNIGSGDGTGRVEFGEDGQTFYVTQADVDLVHAPDRRSVAVQYRQVDLGLAEWGIQHSVKPIKDNKAWTATYRECCTAIAWSGFVLAARIMHAQTLWGHQALFDYQDRYMMTPAREPWMRSMGKFTGNMWDAYRKKF